MKFNLVEATKLPTQSSPATAYLVIDKWDDWGKYRTQFYLYVFDHSGNRHPVGEVKIGQRGLKPGPLVAEGTRAPSLPNIFESLTSDFFSLGQTDSYYEALNELPIDLKSSVLSSLRDIAFDLDLLREFEDELVTSESLLRHVQIKNVTGRFHRLSIGDATLTAFNFSFHVPNMLVIDSHDGAVSFSVAPESMPPSNVHAIIGRNGVGKTRFIQHIVDSILDIKDPPQVDSDSKQRQDGWSFSGIISVSFSAFDELNFRLQANTGIPINFVGLRSKDEKGEMNTKSPADLKDEFVESLSRCHQGIKRERWRIATHGLYSDPVFADAHPLHLLEVGTDELPAISEEFFKRLSSGHKIVLLTITKLVDLVSEKSLVLLDEPEGHLHPPLLSAFIRSLSRFLISRNGVAIVATHSPVVLQEVPRACTWIIHRSGRESKAERPTIETFAENVSVLTREVFGLEVTNTGFMRLINDAISINKTYEQFLENFNGSIGTEGRAIARSLFAIKPKDIPS